MSSPVPTPSRTVSMIAVIVAAPGRREDLRAELTALVAPTRQEPGCRDYRLFELEESPGTFQMHEQFDDEAALEAHRAMPHFQAFAKKAPALLGAPLQLIKLTPLA